MKFFKLLTLISKAQVSKCPNTTFASSLVSAFSIGFQLWSQPFVNRAIQNPDIFVWTPKVFFVKMVAICGCQMVGPPDFRSHLKSGPFAKQPLFDHLKSRLVRISDPHYSVRLDKSAINTGHNNVRFPNVYCIRISSA